MSKLLTISKEEKQKILELHSKEKKSFVNEQKKLKTEKEALAFFKDAKEKGCLTDPNLNFNEVWLSDDETKIFIKGIGKKGAKRVYDDFTWEIVDPTETKILNSGTWACKSSTTPTTPGGDKPTTNDPEITLPDDEKESELTKTIKKGLENISPQTLNKLASDAQIGIDKKFTLQDCEDYISIYFRQANDALYTADLENRKKSIYACFNKYQAKLSNNTRDQLRWLSGNQEGAKTFGVFKRYKNIGTINDNKERSMFRLDRNFK
jgi:hypothetical protein